MLPLKFIVGGRSTYRTLNSHLSICLFVWQRLFSEDVLDYAFDDIVVIGHSIIFRHPREAVFVFLPPHPGKDSVLPILFENVTSGNEGIQNFGLSHVHPPVDLHKPGHVMKQSRCG